MSSRKSKSSTFDKSAIIVAVIGLIGVLVPAFLSYQQSRAQLMIPLQATQTAETVIRTALPTANIIQATVQSTILITPTTSLGLPSTPTPVSMNRTITPGISGGLVNCPAYLVLPNYIFPDQDIVDASDKLRKAKITGDIVHQWQNVSTPSGKTYLRYRIDRSIITTAISGSRNTISRIQEVPDQLNIIEINYCNNHGLTQRFPSIELSSSETAQSQTINRSDSLDNNTSSSGKNDVLEFSLECRVPGIYTVTLSGNTVDSLLPLSTEIIVCPKKQTIWDATAIIYNTSGRNDDQLILKNKYEWDGDKYVIIP